MNSFRYLGLITLDQVDYMTLEEYYLRMKAYRLSRVDRDRDLHYQAYLNLVVQETETRGKKTYSVYPTFESFFNHKEEEKIALGANKEKEIKPPSNVSNLILLANTEGGKHE